MDYVFFFGFFIFVMGMLREGRWCCRVFKSFEISGRKIGIIIWIENEESGLKEGYSWF